MAISKMGWEGDVTCPRQRMSCGTSEGCQCAGGMLTLLGHPVSAVAACSQQADSQAVGHREHEFIKPGQVSAL